jgi:subtilase family serine protease
MLRRLFVRFSLMLAVGAVLPVLAAAASQPRTASRITTPIDANVRVTLHGSVHPLANPQNDRGAVPDSTAINRMLLVLKRPANQDKALAQAIKEMEKPGSKSYHRWLTPEQIGATYGPSAQDIAAITGWLATSGFRVTSVSRASSSVEFSGTAQQVASAFRTQIHSYAWKGKTYTANASDPQIPAALAPVVAGFASLNNFPLQPQLAAPHVEKFDKHSKSWSMVASSSDGGETSATGRPKSNLTFPDPNSGATTYPMTPFDFATIYNVKPLWDAGVDGTGQQIAVIGLSDVTPSDIDQFRSSFGLPAARLNMVHGGDDPGVTQDGYQVDATASVEWAGAIARNATIDLVSTASTAATDGHYLSMTYAVDNIVAPVLADGNITCESALGPAGDLFVYQTWQQAAAEGITVVTSTGNSGSAACDIDTFSVAANGLAVNGFSSTPFDVAVGATDFSGTLGDPTKYWNSKNDPTTLASALSYIPEIPWNSTCASPETFAAFGASSGDQTPAQWCDDVNVPASFPTDYLAPTEAGGGGASRCTTFNPAAYPTRAYCVSGYPKPDWQSGVNGIPADNARDVPDVSFFASTGLFKSYYLYCMSGSINNNPVPACDYSNPDSVEFFASGGTSFASSAFAGVMALVNQKTNSSQGLANYFLYSLAQQEYGSNASPNQSQTNSCNASSDQAGGNSCTFYDITVGSNSIPCDQGTPNCVGGVQEGYGGYIGIIPGWNSTPGYDPVTGLGSMNVTNLVNNWATVAAATQPTTTTLGVSSTSSTYGLPITISGTVAPVSGSGTVAGSVAIVGGLLNEASIPVVNGAFSQSVANLLPGAYSIIANYVGDGGFQGSSSAPVSLVVAEATASTALTFTSTDAYSGGPVAITGNNIPYGENVVATMTVNGTSTASGVAAPTGSIVFTSGGATVANQPLTNNAASYQTFASKLGSYTLTAAYSGDANYNIGNQSRRPTTW